MSASAGFVAIGAMPHPLPSAGPGKSGRQRSLEVRFRGGRRPDLSGLDTVRHGARLWLFHVFDDRRPARFWPASVASCGRGALLHACFSDKQPGDWVRGG